MAEQQVWLVSSGEYSDYSVDRLFATKELADEYVSARGWRDLEEYGALQVEEESKPLITEVSEPVLWLQVRGSVGWVTWKSPSWNTGEDPTEEQHAWFPGIDEGPGPKACEARQTVWEYEHPNVSLWVEGYDIERVRKVYSERRAQILADFDAIVTKARAANDNIQGTTTYMGRTLMLPSEDAPHRGRPNSAVTTSSTTLAKNGYE
jgi:hypothetical protein